LRFSNLINIVPIWELFILTLLLCTWLERTPSSRRLQFISQNNSLNKRYRDVALIHLGHFCARLGPPLVEILTVYSGHAEPLTVFIHAEAASGHCQTIAPPAVEAGLMIVQEIKPQAHSIPESSLGPHTSPKLQHP
jgi:hypothetical protein